MMRALNNSDRWLRTALTAASLAMLPVTGLAQEAADASFEQRIPDNAIPTGDFGDAPDAELAGYQAPYAGVIGNFPTRHFTTNSRYGMRGGQTGSAPHAWLGDDVSIERGARDSLDPDTVENLVNDDHHDDSLRFGPCVQGVPVANPTTLDTTLGIDVTVAAGAPDVTRYLNVLIDLNHDGVWANQPGLVEWVAVDLPVNVTPGTTQTITVGPYINLLDPAASWTRIALTNKPVSGRFADDGSGWDGSGRFKFGEIEDYLLDNELASDFAWAYRAASDSDVDADLAGAFALADPPDAVSVAGFDANARATAIAAALAIAQAEASAAAVSVAAAQASAAAAASARASAEASAGAVAAACISCPCATLCASAGAGATAAVDAAVHAQAAADAAVVAAVAAEAHASAQAAALAIALADVNVHVTAFAAAVASAQAEAGSFATAYADATAAASAYATSFAAAMAATCNGDASTFATAMADAYAHAYASADAFANAWAYAAASATAWSTARVSITTITRTETLALTYADSSSFAAAMALSFAAAAAEAEASAQAAALSMSEAFAVVVGACGGDCCDNDGGATTTGRPDRYRDGGGTRTSSRAGASASIVLLSYVATSTEITGFTWQGVETGGENSFGVGDFVIYDPATVTTGGANGANAMFQGQNVPVSQTPVTDECGNPVFVDGAPLFEYQMDILPIPTIPGEEMYFGVRGVGAPGYQSEMVTAHTDPQNPDGPSFYLSPQEGIFNAVPVGDLDNCDRDYVASPMTGNSGAALRDSNDGHEGHDHTISRKTELTQRNMLRSLASGTSGGTQR